MSGGRGDGGVRVTQTIVAQTMETDRPPAFDPAAGWMLHPRVAVRPERFGALLYHYGTRRLSFLKDRRLLEVVEGLARHPSALAACAAAGVAPDEQRTFTAALARLASSDMLVRSQLEEDTP